MIIFVGGMIGAGKSTIAKGLAKSLCFPYYDVDEIKKVVYRKDANYDKNMREGITFSDELRYEVYDLVSKDLQALVKTEPHIVVDETLHKRDTRHALYDEAQRLAGGFIVVWVHADEELILQRLGSQKREGHILDNPLPMHQMLRDEFEPYQRCIIDCPNNGASDETIADLVNLIDNIAILSVGKHDRR